MTPTESAARGAVRGWHTRFTFLIVLGVAVPIGFSVWNALLNNFAVDYVGLSGFQNGVMQSIREVPGFLAFTVVFVLLILREQTFAIVALAVFGIGIGLTGIFPNVFALYCCVVLMSIGFHYMETIRQSLSLQWLPKRAAPRLLGKLQSIGALTALIVFGCLWVLLDQLEVPFVWLYLISGSLVVAMAVYLKVGFPHFKSRKEQRKTIVLRGRYWLYYALTFMSGARRQIFVAFAGFLMVQKFAFAPQNMAALMMANHVVTWLLAERVGRIVGRIGERRALTIEYTGLIIVFVLYGVVESGAIAAVLYVIDHFFFAFAIAIKTYFQKIADPSDIASSAGVSFTMNHIAAVIAPAVLGLVWMQSVSAVFFIGAGFAFVSLMLSQNVPLDPRQGNEVYFLRPRKPAISVQ